MRFVFDSQVVQVTYALGVLVRVDGWSDVEDALPWLVGSIGTVIFDFVIITQCMCYRNAVRWARLHCPYDV